MKIYTLLYLSDTADSTSSAEVIKVSTAKEALQGEALAQLNDKLSELGITKDEIASGEVFVYKSETEFSINAFGDCVSWTIQEFEV
jgi:hypothetical protein